MTAANVLGQMAGMLVSGGIEVVDCSGVLGPDTPLLKLPPDFAKDTPPIKIHRISEYDQNGPFWAWNWLELGEHSGTHFDAPHHWITGKDYADGYTDSLPVQRLIAPVNVLDFSMECAADPDFLLTIDHVKAWEAKHGAINAGEWVVLRSDWDSRAHDEQLFLNANETGPHTPGPTAEAIEYLIEKGIVGWGSQCISSAASYVYKRQGHRRLGQPVHRHRRGSGRRHDATLPGAQPAAQEQPLRIGVAGQSGQAAGQGRNPDRGTAEDQERYRLAHPRAGIGAAGVRCSPIMSSSVLASTGWSPPACWR